MFLCEILSAQIANGPKTSLLLKFLVYTQICYLTTKRCYHQILLLDGQMNVVGIIRGCGSSVFVFEKYFLLDLTVENMNKQSYACYKFN